MAREDALSQEDFAKWPFGDAARPTIVFGATMSFEARNSKNVFVITATAAATISLESDYTLLPQNVTKNIERHPGDEIIFVVSSDGTGRDMTFSTGFTSPVLAGVISKTKVYKMVYVNETLGFVPVAAGFQID